MIVAGADQERQTIDHDPLDESHLAFQPPGGRVYTRIFNLMFDIPTFQRP